MRSARPFLGLLGLFMLIARCHSTSTCSRTGSSDDYRTWIAPDIVAEMTSANYRENHDPAMLAVRRYLERQRTRTAARTD